jgi:hypothetical protein
MIQTATEPDPLLRRHRRRKTVRANFKVPAVVMDRFVAIADARGLELGELLARALAAFLREAREGKTQRATEHRRHG